MTEQHSCISPQPFFTIGVPSYNRARYLPELLESILAQSFQDYEVLVCEDCSPEREEILTICSEYEQRFAGKLRLVLNPTNLGYDGNIRSIASLARGKFCFYLGNDDLLADDALVHASSILRQHPTVTFLLRAYAWFSSDPRRPDEIIRYFPASQLLPQADKFRVCYRRSGVISGFCILTAAVNAVPTSKYDGTLYYQMYMALCALTAGDAYYCHHVLTLSRTDVPPDFGNSETEKGKFIPGGYSAEARFRMVAGSLQIFADYKGPEAQRSRQSVIRDYANYFYPYIHDQLDLPISRYLALYRKMAATGLGDYAMFHLYMVGSYVLKKRLCDSIIHLGRTLFRPVAKSKA